MIGRTVSHYRILSQLGAGGMGVVYRAEDVRLGREVALKFVSEDFLHDEQAVARLRSEARAASALNHPNICTIFDVGEDNGHPFIVMELMKGQTLREKLAAGPLKVHQLVDIGIEIADALHSTHSDGIIHRDVKPGNIFLTERGHVKILDFGLAKLTPRFVGATSTAATVDQTMAGMTLGTISYMSPEQATGEELDGRTDLFSLGVVLYECATGKHPFPGKTSAVVLNAILSRAPLPPLSLNPELPVRLQEIINNCLEKDRELRYQSAADLRADLKRLRRDIESGHSRAYMVADAEGATVMVSSATRPGSTASPTAANAPSSSGSAPAAVVSAGGAVAVRSNTGAIVAVAIAVAALAAGGWALWTRTPTEPAATTTASPTLLPPDTRVDPLTAAAIENRLSLARASLEARNYRAALAYAGEVLAAEAGHAEAARVRDEARGMLAKFDEAVADARRLLAAGDVSATARALEAARDLDPAAPIISELTASLSALVRERDQAAREQGARSQTPRPTPAAPTPSAASGAGRSATARVEAPASASQRTDSARGTGTSPNPPAGASPAAGPPPVSAPPEPPPAASPPPASLAAPSLAAASPPASARVDAPAATAPPPRSAESDDAVIRRVVATYGRAIENKDLALFRSVKPNLSGDEERRLVEGFRAVTTQQVNLTIASIKQQGDTAAVAVRRRDVITAGGRQRTVESQQTLSLSRGNSGWVITEIR